MLSAILFTLQAANWQRGGGKGTKPQIVKRPSDGPEVQVTAEELAQKRAAFDDELARRRALRDA